MITIIEQRTFRVPVVAEPPRLSKYFLQYVAYRDANFVAACRVAVADACGALLAESIAREGEPVGEALTRALFPKIAVQLDRNLLRWGGID